MGYVTAALEWMRLLSAVFGNHGAKGAKILELSFMQGISERDLDLVKRDQCVE